MATGTITHLRLDRGYCHAEVQGEPDRVFINAKDMCGLELDEQLQFRRVELDIVYTVRGPKGFNVRPAN